MIRYFIINAYFTILEWFNALLHPMADVNDAVVINEEDDAEMGGACYVNPQTGKRECE